MADLQTNADNLLKKIGEALDQMLTLNIETVVCDIDVAASTANDPGSWSLQPKAQQASDAIKTSILLAQGDIQNAMTPGALANEKLMAMHKEQVTLSRQIVSDNLNGLVALAQNLLKKI